MPLLVDILRSRAAASALSVALLVAACGSTGPAATQAPSTSAPGPVGSGSAGACPTPAAPSGLGAWAPPSSAPTVFPVIVSSEVTCGANRVVFSFLDAQNASLATPDRRAHVAFYDLAKDPTTPVATRDGTFDWAIENVKGVYVTSMDFPEAGLWGAEFTTAKTGEAPTTVRMTFDVVPTGSALRVGDKAPASQTPTAASVGGDLAKLATDPKPDPRFYQASVADVVGKKPFVLVFATPKFCTSGVCGPTLDRVKPLADQFPTVTFINVEPYKLTWTGTQLQPVLDASNQLQPIDAVNEWGILSEPWIFVVDRSGIVRGSFEGVAGTSELAQSIAAVR